MFRWLKLPIFGRKKLLLAFEYGAAITETAREMKVDITPEFMERAEKMIENEFRTQTPTFLATNIVPNILSVFELDIRK